MKSIERRREDFANLLNDENCESVIEQMYESGEIYDKADALSIEEQYENFKKVVNKQIKKRRIKNIARWLDMILNYEDLMMVRFFDKYRREEVDKD